jgi:hypothetical protein
MANQNVAQSSAKVLRYVSHLEHVAEEVEEREEQLYALASAILVDLTPKDEKNIPDGYPITAWRLAQILGDMLSQTSHRKCVRESLLIGA